MSFCSVARVADIVHVLLLLHVLQICRDLVLLYVFQMSFCSNACVADVVLSAFCCMCCRCRLVLLHVFQMLCCLRFVACAADAVLFCCLCCRCCLFSRSVAYVLDAELF